MKKSLLLLLVLVFGLFMVIGCEDDTATGPDENEADAWVGTWLSAGDNVAVILSYYFGVDSIEAVFNEDNTVSLRQHAAGGTWTEFQGTYIVTESDDIDVDAISLVYETFEQEGIVEIVGDTLRLEVVQTLPDYGLTIPTPALGFGADADYLTTNIQTYILQD